MKLQDLDLSSINNSRYTVKHYLLINKETSLKIPMIKIARDTGCIEQATEILKGTKGIVTLFGRHSDNCNNFGSPNTVTLEKWVAVNRSAMYLLDENIYNTHIKYLLEGDSDYIPIGAKYTHSIKRVTRNGWLKEIINHSRSGLLVKI